jgi:prevent-host-death family protein
MTYQVSYSEAKRRLHDLIDAAMCGETVLITLDNQKVIQLVPRVGEKPHPQYGSAKGLVEIAEDFDEPLADFSEYMP